MMRQINRCGWMLALLLSGSVAAAQENPPYAFFTGGFELVGRAPGGEGQPVSDWVEITETGQSLTLNACGIGAGNLSLEPASADRGVELTGHLGEWNLFCRFMNDGDNYPRLMCYAVDGPDTKIPGLFAFWPVHWPLSEGQGDCLNR